MSQSIDLSPKLQPPWVRKANKSRLEANIARVMKQKLEPIIVPAGVTDLQELPGYVKPKRVKKENPMNDNNHVTETAVSPTLLAHGPGAETTEPVNHRPNPLAPVVVSPIQSTAESESADARKRVGTKGYSDRFTAEVVAAWHQRMAEGMEAGEIAKREGVSEQTVNKYLKKFPPETAESTDPTPAPHLYRQDIKEMLAKAEGKPVGTQTPPPSAHNRSGQPARKTPGGKRKRNGSPGTRLQQYPRTGEGITTLYGVSVTIRLFAPNRISIRVEVGGSK